MWLTSVLWPGAQVAGWSRSAPGGPRQRLIAVPNASSATQFLPWRPSTVAASARRASDDRPRLRQWKDAAGVLGLLTLGALRSSRRVAVHLDARSPDEARAEPVQARTRRTTARLAQSGLAGHVAEQLGLDVASSIVLCGPPRANQKPILQLHDRRGRTLAYVKVAWNPLTAQLLHGELAALTHLAHIDHPDFIAPVVLGNGQWADGSWLAVGPVGVGHRLRPQQAAIDRLALAVQRTSAGWHGVAVDAPFVRQLVDDAAGLAAGQIAVERVLTRHADLELHLAARHGDFVPWNILSGRPVSGLWDWERYDQLAPVGSDRIHHRVQMGIQRAGMTFPDAVAGIATRLGTILPELPLAVAQAHLDWYLAEVLVRYEHDAQSNPTPRLLDRIAKLTSILEQRMQPTDSSRPLDPARRAM